MARPRKTGVDYFQHDTNAESKKTLFILQSRFGNDGYAFWFKLLEILGTQEGLYLDCGNPDNWQFLTAKTCVDDKTAAEILNILSVLGAIDAQLWEEKIIWVQKFVDRLSVLFNKRASELPQKPSSRSVNPTREFISVSETPHRIEENSIVNIPPSIPPRGETETLKENEQDESLTVKTAGGSGSEKPVDHSMTLVSECFLEFWECYPKKIGKGAVEKIWRALKPNDELFNIIITTLNNAKKTEQWQRDNGRFIPNPATWLKQKRWEDEYDDISQTESSFDTDDFFETALKKSERQFEVS